VWGLKGEAEGAGKGIEREANEIERYEKKAEGADVEIEGAVFDVAACNEKVVEWVVEVGYPGGYQGVEEGDRVTKEAERGSRNFYLFL